MWFVCIVVGLSFAGAAVGVVCRRGLLGLLVVCFCAGEFRFLGVYRWFVVWLMFVVGLLVDLRVVLVCC